MFDRLSDITETETVVISNPDTDRYHTFGYIPWWKPEIIRNATVMVVGAGALGNEVLKNLALMGIGRVFIVDFDTVERANLSRSVLFRTSDEGEYKAKVAATRVKELNPDVQVQYFHGDVNYNLGLGVFRRMDAIVSCLDNRAARLSVNRFCWALNKSWVDGALLEMNGEARVFRPNDGACYECTLTENDYAIINMRTSCPGLAQLNILQGKVPTTPTISSIIAAVETQDTLKLLHGMNVQAGAALVFQGLTNDVYTIQLPIKEDCQSHWVWKDIVELKGCQATTTIRQLLEIVRNDLGETANLEFIGGLGRNIIVTLDCPKCNIETPIYRPQHEVSNQDAICPNCQNQRIPNLTHIITGREGFLDKTLADLGIPPLHIIPARCGDIYRFYELTGDLESMFHFQ